MKARNYNLPEVFNNTSLGFVFEFYSSKKTEFIVEQLAHITTKNVILTNSRDYAPSFANAILIKEYEGKKPRYSFELGQQRYDSIIPLMREVTEWLSETAECKKDNLMRVNMSFDHSHLRTLYSLSKMNTQKLILKIDEDYIYERFPSQKGSPYAISIKQLLPVTESQYTHDIVKNVNFIIGQPNKSYFGVNTTNQTRGILEFNYIGGEDYADKEKEIIEVLEYYILKTYQTLNEDVYSKEELRELEYLTEEFYKIQEAYYEPEKFRELFPEISVAVDLRRDTQMIKTYWPQIRATLFETVVNNNFRKGEFNYDREYSVFQLRNAEIKSTTLKDFDLVKCELQGVYENCNFISCKVDKARIYKSKIVNNCRVTESYLQQVSAEAKNIIQECFVENNYEILNCVIKESVIKFAGIGSAAKLDESSVVVSKEKGIQQPKVGVEVEELRDYKWLQKIANSKPASEQPYGNEYVRKRYI